MFMSATLSMSKENRTEQVKKKNKNPETEIVQMVGQYLVDHAEELYAVAYTDLTGNNIQIRLKRKGKT